MVVEGVVWGRDYVLAGLVMGVVYLVGWVMGVVCFSRCVGRCGLLLAGFADLAGRRSSDGVEVSVWFGKQRREKALFYHPHPCDCCYVPF